MMLSYHKHLVHSYIVTKETNKMLAGHVKSVKSVVCDSWTWNLKNEYM